MVLPERYSLTTPAQKPENMHWTPNPKSLLVIRFIFTVLTCLMALATSIMTAVVINYFMSHQPMIFPPMSSMIFMTMIGFLTCIIYFGYFIFLPSLSFMRRGSMLWIMFTMKIEIFFLFGMSAIWISAALAYAADYRGHENCIWDGYYHYPKPSNWNHLCDMINWVVGMAYATFGIQVAFFAFDLFMVAYMFLFVDQDSISEPFYEWGTRAWEYKHQREAPISSVHNPMMYRAKGGPIGGATTLGRGGDTRYKEKDIYEGVTESSNTYRDSSYTETDSSSSATRRGYSRRGAAYSDPSNSDTISDDSSTVASSSNHYGGAYSRHTVNSVRAGLGEAPMAAGTGGTNAGVPTWSAPSITTDGDSVMRPHTSIRGGPRQVRHVSAPISLGSRGRRGTSYGGDSALDTVDDDFESFTEDYEGSERRPSTGPAAGRDWRRSRRRVSMDEESGWHLRED
ncbi:hypothetical protein ACI68E_001521 [Malassezia pachydermatis]|uniref:MARVEL domain-containing protein n=1 Tax=Malassezia pachydermatis TaxID=77020 RepID=A0A0M8MPZ6_9BASI|nr:hypothetical protein Malapachy_3275 [Malassezia pachydermatis]KOS16008.1 hypothetical protein Malapachy_3275 [Malassezia pachydermatis]